MAAIYRTLGLQEMTPVEHAMILSATERSRALAGPADASSAVAPTSLWQDAEPSRTPPTPAFLSAAIEDLESAIERDPYEWIYHYKICDLYLEARQYARAIRSSESALALRPNDPRSYYALATAYRMLTQARYTEPDGAGRPRTSTVPRKAARLDPQPSLEALSALGLTVGQAATRSRQLFTQMLEFNISPDERKFVREVCLTPLKKEFNRPERRSLLRAGRSWSALALLISFGLVVVIYASGFSPSPRDTSAGATPPDGQPGTPISAAGATASVSAPETTSLPLSSAAPAPELSGAGCAYGARFEPLVRILGGGLVGGCIADERVNNSNGDVEQHTANGLLAWHKADDLAAFTNGASSWYACRERVEQRPSTESFRCSAAVTTTTLLVDRFDDPATARLPRSSSDPLHYSSGYLAGEYQIRTLDPNWEFGPAEYLAERYTDTSLSIDVRIAGPADNRYLALVCRSQDPTDSQYRLTVVPAEGWVVLTRWDGGKPVHLTRQQRSGSILPGDQVNHLELTCAGDAISASINGALVAFVLDGTYREGKLGISASSFAGSRSTVDARFDNLVVVKR